MRLIKYSGDSIVEIEISGKWSWKYVWDCTDEMIRAIPREKDGSYARGWYTW